MKKVIKNQDKVKYMIHPSHGNIYKFRRSKKFLMPFYKPLVRSHLEESMKFYFSMLKIKRLILTGIVRKGKLTWALKAYFAV